MVDDTVDDGDDMIVVILSRIPMRHWLPIPFLSSVIFGPVIP